MAGNPANPPPGSGNQPVSRQRARQGDGAAGGSPGSWLPDSAPQGDTGGWWGRARSNLRRAVREMREGLQRRSGGADSASAAGTTGRVVATGAGRMPFDAAEDTDDTDVLDGAAGTAPPGVDVPLKRAGDTESLPVVPHTLGPAGAPVVGGLSRAPRTLARPGAAGPTGGPGASGMSRVPGADGNPLAAAWRDPARRPWLFVGALALLVVIGLILAAPMFRAPGTPAPSTIGLPPIAEGQPALPPADATAVAPGAPGAVPPAPGAPAASPLTANQLGLAGLPLLLGLFWLLSAWLVDVEARRAFVVREPWGERRTFPYSCLAVGCVFPLILAGLLFAAWGFVTFVLYIANRQSWTAGIRAGALVLLACAVLLLLRGFVTRWLADRRN